MRSRVVFTEGDWHRSLQPDGDCGHAQRVEAALALWSEEIVGQGSSRRRRLLVAVERNPPSSFHPFEKIGTELVG